MLEMHFQIGLGFVENYGTVSEPLKVAADFPDK